MENSEHYYCKEMGEQKPTDGGIVCANHKYVHMETAKNEVHCGSYVTYKKCDRFFCEKCLDIKEIDRVETIEACKGRPAWY